ncbi:large subunit ribosomal protein L10 [Brevibacterium pityocampae]
MIRMLASAVAAFRAFCAERFFVFSAPTSYERNTMARPDKAAAVAELKQLLENSPAAVLTEYRGLTVAQMKDLRVALGETASYAVVKNTLTAIAAKEAGIEAFDGLLNGPSAIAFITGEPSEAAKALRDFAKANPQLVIKAGYLEGKPLTADEITKLADLESREVLLAKAAGAMKGSLYKAAYMFTAPLVKTVRTVDALREKNAGSEAAATEDA